MIASVVGRLVALREASGLTQGEVAALLGTSQPVIARLEAGGRDPRLSTLERYARAVGANVEVRRSTATESGSAVRLAERIRGRLLARSESASATFRELIQFVDDMSVRSKEERGAAIRQEPLSTGDRRWDAAVAAAVDWVAAVHGLDLPRWNGSARWRLPPPGWVLTPHGRLHSLVRENTPVQFSRHGVYVDRASLTSV